MQKNETRSERLWRAESLITLLGQMDTDRLPAQEGQAVGEVQSEAIDEWLKAYVDLRGPKADSDAPLSS